MDEGEGYAYLRQRRTNEGEETELPRLVQRRALSYPVSLLLALLRKRLAEFDALSAETRLILERSEIAEMVRVFLPEKSDEAGVLDRIDAHISKLIEMGFLRRLGKGKDEKLEVRRILKAFVDAQWLHTFSEQLEQYRKAAGGSTDGSGGDADEG